MTDKLGYRVDVQGIDVDTSSIRGSMYLRVVSGWNIYVEFEIGRMLINFLLSSAPFFRRDIKSTPPVERL